MAAHVTVRSAGGYRVEADNGRHVLTMDLPLAEGGDGSGGMGAKEMLLAALGGCTAMTLALYAKRKGWPLEGVGADLEHRPAPAPGGEEPDRIAMKITLMGPLDEAQRTRLLEIAGKCPVHRMLSRGVAVDGRLA